MARKDAAKASALPVDRYRKEIGMLICTSMELSFEVFLAVLQH